jgi:two-component system, OmpR family, sensor kinase
VLETEFGPRVAATGHVLELVVDGPVFARGDEGRVLQIGRNLIENAITHTPPGTAITVTAGTEGDRAVLSVADDGPGIPDDARQAVFDRFYRLGGTVASGSGLGLAIARELAELMGGDIELESRPGLTRFTLVLPSEAGRPAETLVVARRG